MRRLLLLQTCHSGDSILIVLSKSPSSSENITEHLRLQDELPLLVLLALLERLVVLPPHVLAALSARDVSHEVSPRRHVPLAGLTLDHVDHHVEQVCLTMLASEVLFLYTGD